MSSSEFDEFEVIDQSEASLSEEELAKVHAWLQPTDYEAQSSEFHRHLSSQAPGTGLWICKTSKYRQWQESNDHGSLWIKGAPGAGKSVTAASMIQHLQHTEGTPVLYFFFRYIILANRHPRSLIRDFLAQLLPFSVRLQARLQPLICSPLDDFSDESLWEHLLSGLSSMEKAYCVIDALDEMELLPNDGFLDRLNNVATFRPSAVKLLITSRPKQHLQSSLRDASIVHISLEDDLVGKDIALFLLYRLKMVLPLDDQTGFRESLVSAISERSDGLFLFARLLLDQIIPKLDLAQVDVETLVKSLPVGLEEMYNSMLFQQAYSLKIDMQIQVFLLELATHSCRALRLNEISSAMASTFPASMIPDTPKVIARNACAPLLEILEDETVSVIHHSFTEFLLNSERTKVGKTPQFPAMNPEKVNKRLSLTCMEYLQIGGLRVHNDDPNLTAFKVPANDPDPFYTRDKETDGYNYQEARLHYPFLEYAVGNWAFHASKYDFEDDDFFKSIAGFMDPESIDFKKWLELEWMKGMKSSEIQAPSPLHIAAFAGLTTYANKLLEGGVLVDPRDAEGRTPLHWACARGHTSMASLLLENGAIPDPDDTRGARPIHEAARKNHSVIVKMLLEAGVDPLTPKTKENVKRRLRCGDVSTKGETAVEYLWLQGHTDTIMIMLPYLTPEALEELFCQCCRYGKSEAVRAILKNTNLSPNSRSSGATALYLTCRAQSFGIVELLLAKGADVHETSEWKVKNRNICGRRVHEEPVRLPIDGVVMGWKPYNDLASQQVLHLLLNAGADIEAKDANGDTTLLSLFRDHNHDDADFVVVNGVLQAGANVLALDKNGDSALHRCLRGSRDIKIIKLLFEYGACADVIGKDGDSTLHAAMTSCSPQARNTSLTDVLKLLLEMGALCDVKNRGGITALEQAACNWDCSLESFTILLGACTDANTLKRCLWQLSRRKDSKETIKFIRMLQNYGVSLEERNSNGETVLLKSTASRDLFEAFLECGADINAIDSKGRGVLHHYISNIFNGDTPECLRRLEEMVDMGLDPMQADYDGNNLLHVRSKVYEGKSTDDFLIEKLLDYGISVHSKNNHGMNPLHVHLENWDARCWKNSINKQLDERFYERHEIPLLNSFRRRGQIVDINAQDSDNVTIFHLAALRSETRLFYLLEQDANHAILTKKGRNALHLACRARQCNVVGYLSQTYKIMVNQQDEYGRTPLHDACISGQVESVRLLLKAGADISIIDKNKRTPLHACAEFSDEERMRVLLSRPGEGAIRVLRDRFRPTSQTSHPYQPWYADTWHRHESTAQDLPSIGSIISELIWAGSDVMANDSHHQTPLDLALEYDCQEMIQALQFSAVSVRQKWDLEPTDQRLPTLLALKRLRNSSLSKMDPENPSREQIIQSPSTYLPFLTIEDIDWITQNGGNITGCDDSKPIQSSGQSLLHIATSKGLNQLVEDFGPLARINDDPKFVLARINKQLVVDPKYSPGLENLAPTLHIACMREFPNMDMVEILVEKCGVDVSARALVKPERYAKLADSVEGGTALHILAKGIYWWQLEALKYLLKKGAKIDAVNEKGETPLQIACTGTTYAAMNCQNDVYGYWRVEVVKILLKAGADIRILDKNSLSCLHKASSSPKILRILLDHGADIYAGKFSPIFSAIQIQCLEALTILLDAGVCPNTVDPCIGNEGFDLHYTVKDKIRTALLCASFASLHNQKAEDSAPMVRLLIERGADMYAAVNDKETLIHYVFENAEFEIISAFLECATKTKIDFNIRDSRGYTVFLAACEWYRCLPGYRHRHWVAKDTAPFLRTLEFGADPLVLDSEGRNAQHHLLDNYEMEEDAIIQFLAHDCAKSLLHQKDKNGFTPLNCALRFLRPAVVEVLIAMGLDLLTPDPTGATALHRIAKQCLRASTPSRRGVYQRNHIPEYYNGALALWKKFIALGGSINIRDSKGAPALFYFLSTAERDVYGEPEDRCCHIDYFKTYFSEEVTPDLDLRATNKNGENALHIIARREQRKKIYRKREHSGQEHDNMPTHDKELYQFFVRKGLNALQEDGKGRSSLDVAAACEQKGILELFQYGK